MPNKLKDDDNNTVIKVVCVYCGQIRFVNEMGLVEIFQEIGKVKHTEIDEVV